jgi:hypothetical protein
MVPLRIVTLCRMHKVDDDVGLSDSHHQIRACRPDAHSVRWSIPSETWRRGAAGSFRRIAGRFTPTPVTAARWLLGPATRRPIVRQRPLRGRLKLPGVRLAPTSSIRATTWVPSPWAGCSRLARSRTRRRVAAESCIRSVTASSADVSVGTRRPIRDGTVVRRLRPSGRCTIGAPAGAIHGRSRLNRAPDRESSRCSESGATQLARSASVGLSRAALAAG